MIRETWIQSQVASYQRLLKWYLIPPCLTLGNIRYLSRVKVEQFWERSSATPLHLGVVAIEKGAFWSPSTKVANFTYFILVQLPSSFFSIRLFSVYLVHLFSSIDTTDAWKKLRFISSNRSDLHMSDNLSVGVHAFASRELMSFLVDETLLSR